MQKKLPTSGLRHVALFVENFEECEKFYVELLGMTVEWRPDSDNVYLTSGNDNLALHRRNSNQACIEGTQRLDHIGFIINDISAVDEWYTFLKKHGVSIKAEPRTHRDGARSFYCADPDGTIVQLIFHPPLAVR